MTKEDDYMKKKQGRVRESIKKEKERVLFDFCTVREEFEWNKRMISEKEKVFFN